MKSNTLVTIFICVFLGGCASTPIPVKKPITSGIFNQEPPKSQMNLVPNGKEEILAIMLSENSKSTIDYLKKTMEYFDELSKSKWRAGVEDIFSARRDVYNPEFEIKYITAGLKQYFGKVTLITSINDFSPEKHSALAIIDIFRSSNNGWSSFEEVSNVHTEFYDSKLQKITTVGTNYKENIQHSMNGENDNYTSRVHQVVVKSLNAWELELNKSMRSPPITAQSFDYNECMRTANSMKEKSLKPKAIEFCVKEKASN